MLLQRNLSESSLDDLQVSTALARRRGLRSPAWSQGAGSGCAIMFSMYGRYVGPQLIVQNGYIPSGVL